MQSIRRSTRLRGALEYRQLFGNFQALTNTRMSIHTILCTRCTQNRLDISVMTSFSTYKKLLSPKHRLAHSLLKSSHCGESSISRAHILSPASICSYRYLTTKDKSDKQTIGEDKLKIDWSRASAIHSTALPGGAREVSESWVSRGKYSIPYKTISVVQKEGTIGDEVCVRGYVKSDRRQKDVTFLDVTDGTVMHALQVVGTPESIPRVNTGAVVGVSGTLRMSEKTGKLELHAEEVTVLGDCAKDYPMQKKKMSMEHLREWSHLRGRTNTIGAALRIRNRAYMAMHDYYQRNQYTHYPTPLLTASDCEGAGEMLRVTHSNPSNQMAADLFGAPSFLTVSGQLHLECGSYALGDCYTFGPAFRAENSHTRRHLAEFYMLEAELFYTDTVDDVIRTLSKSFKHTISEVLAHCADEVDFLSKWVDTDLRSRLEAELARPIVALSYTDAVEIINTNYAGKSELKWGDDLSSEHELWLTEEWCKGSVFITDYPSAIKPFYMLRNDDGNTAACVDMLVPRVCELAGGSLREHRVDVLRNNIAAHASPDTAEDADTNLDRQGKQDSKPNHMEWYEDLRKYGGVPHGGFGLGFERLVQYLTGIRNIRDVIPFPRVPGAIKY